MLNTPETASGRDRPAPGRRWRADPICLAVLAALAVLFVAPALMPGKVLLPTDLLLLMQPWKHAASRYPEFRQAYNPLLDAIQQFYPWRAYGAEWLRQGEIPLWNARACGGTPFVGNDQSALFYPKNILFWLLPVERAFAVNTVAFFFLAGASMYGLLRVLGARSWAALTGGIAFEFNGFFIGWLEFPPFRSVMAWLPLILLCLELAVRRRSVRWAAGAGVAVGCQFLAGNLHISTYLMLCLVVYAVFRVVLSWREEGSPAAWRAAGFVAGALALGGALAAIQLLPVLELAPMCARPAATYQAAIAKCFPLRHVFALLVPDFFGNPVDHNYWAEALKGSAFPYTEACGYAGTVTLVLAGLALAWRRGATVWLFAGLALAGLLLAFGTPLNRLPYHLVPAFKGLTGLNRAIVIFTFAAPVLAGLGAETVAAKWEADESRAVRKAALTGAILTGAVVLAMGLYLFVVGPALEGAIRGFYAYEWKKVGLFGAFAAGALVIVAVGGTLGSRRALVLLAILAAADMFVFGQKFNPVGEQSILHLDFEPIRIMQREASGGHMVSLGSLDARGFLNRLPPNLPMTLGLRDIQGSDSLRTKRWADLEAAMRDTRSSLAEPAPNSRLLDLIGTRFIYTPRYLAPADGFELISTSAGNLYRNKRALPRAYVAAAVRGVASAEQARSAVLGPEWDPRQETVVIGAGLPTHSRTWRALSVQDHGPNRLTIRGPVRAGEWVVLNDAYYPGWWAQAGGKREEMKAANWAVRAVAVRADVKQVQVAYLPASFLIGQFVTAVGLGALMLILSFCRPRQMRDEEAGG